MELKDSGNRKMWDTGAVRDREHGKGRMDLMSLDVMAKLYKMMDWDDYIYNILMDFYKFQIDPNEDFIYDAIHNFLDNLDREGKWDLPQATIEVSRQAEDGADKYADRNWELGMPVSRFVDSAIRHFTQYIAGYTDEPHDRAFLWNCMSAIWMMNHKPEMLDYPIDYNKVAEQVATKKKEKESFIKKTN